MADPKVRSGIASSVMSMQYQDEFDAIKNIRCPLTIVHGENDRLVNIDYIKEFILPLSSNIDLCMINNSGHYPHFEQSEQFEKSLRKKT